MENEIFIVILAIVFYLLLRWGFKALPGERWQIMATVPVRKIDSDRWDGFNLTYYGLFSANAYLMSMVIMFVLFGSIKIDIKTTVVLIIIMLAFCIPMARIVAIVVEKKAHTRTVGGAVFVGLLLAPLAILAVNKVMGSVESVPIMPFMAALAISYSLGEGIGRLACISFGCCYGRALSECSPLLQRLFRDNSFIFSGKTKKIAYESGLEGERVFPVQAITAGLFTATGLFCTYLFLNGFYAVSFLFSVLVTQGWRALSEIFRADYRGGGRISVYQIMGIVAIMYSLILWNWSDDSNITANIMEGIHMVWQPEVIIFLLLVWLGIFLHTGCSKVTGSIISFHVHRDRI
jgi:Prolipoprotein diacylglyceryl transferase